MMDQIASFAQIAAVSGIAYNVLCLWSAAIFLRARKAVGEDQHSSCDYPPVSILKPLKGTDPEMYENFRSHCLQDYPKYEIIFGVSDSADPAGTAVDRLRREFPQQTMRIVVCEKTFAANVKVGNLAQMAAAASNEHLVVSDSDIRVGPDYLSRVVAPLHEGQTGEARIGLVTCLYRGKPSSNLGSRLESVGIGTDFVPGVLAAQTVENGLSFGLGSTLAFRRSDLAAIGGFESFADYLADDYELGNRISDLGLKVILSDEVVETILPQYSFSEFIRHQLRWSRTIRDSRYWGFVGLLFTFGLPWALLAVLFSKGGFRAWALVCIALSLRFAVATVVGRYVLEDKKILRLAWLIPVRDILGVFIWMASFIGNTIVWRGERFRLRNGRLIPLADESSGGK